MAQEKPEQWLICAGQAAQQGQDYSEFKRDINKSSKELIKLNLLRKNIENDKKMIKISQSAHWFIQMKAPTNQGFETKVIPYLNMDQLKNMTETHSFEYFIKEIVKRVFSFTENKVEINIGVSEDEMQRYLQFLGKLYRKAGVKSGGLVMNVSPNGGLTYVVVNDITQMIDKHKTVVNEHQRRLSRSLQWDRDGFGL